MFSVGAVRLALAGHGPGGNELTSQHKRPSLKMEVIWQQEYPRSTLEHEAAASSRQREKKSNG
jgi:hypothetical protein